MLAESPHQASVWQYGQLGEQNCSEMEHPAYNTKHQKKSVPKVDHLIIGHSSKVLTHFIASYKTRLQNFISGNGDRDYPTSRWEAGVFSFSTSTAPDFGFHHLRSESQSPATCVIAKSPCY